MSLDQTAYTIDAATHAAGGAATVAILAAMGAAQLALLLILWRAFRSDGPDDDSPGSDGDGPGRGRRRPRKPPPDAPDWWPEFERDFAEHVAALGRRSRTM
jgi:hypothetical protein